MAGDLWVIRTEADIAVEDLAEALAAATADPLVAGAPEGLTVAGTGVAARLAPALGEAEFGGPPLSDSDRELLEADPRKHPFVILAGRPSAWPSLVYAGMVLANELGASLYDPQKNEWLAVDDHALADLRDELDRK
jgi:hypothetical protein